VKPSPFTYHRPAGLAEALEVLAEVGADGKVLAGGQSLLPILSMRLAAPEHLVDINRVPDLDGIGSGPDGVRVGALVRHAALQRDEGAAATLPLLRQALGLVAHPTIRNRGTTVGSLVHADPSGEMTAVLTLVGGSVEIASASGRRTVDAEGFFLGPLTSAVGAGELAVEARFPALPPRTGTAFLEVARRHGDYAVCGVAAAVTLTEGGDGVESARAAYISMAPIPAVLDLPGPDGDPAVPQSWAAAGERAADDLDPEPDLHATAEYRQHLARVLTQRGLAEAARAAAAQGGR
jgi:aerobic carbon-monoxide dehydrogenase medium subunit